MTVKDTVQKGVLINILQKVEKTGLFLCACCAYEIWLKYKCENAPLLQEAHLEFVSARQSSGLPFPTAKIGDIPKAPFNATLSISRDSIGA